MMQGGPVIWSTEPMQLDPKDLLQLILDVTLTLVDGDVGSILVRDKSTSELRLLVGRGIPAHAISSTGTVAIGKIANYVLEKGKMLVLDADRMKGEQVSWLKRPDLTASIIVPIRTGERVAGALCIASRTRRRFRQVEVDAVDAIGSELGSLLMSLTPIPSDYISLRHYLESTAHVGASQLLEQNMDVLLHIGLLATQSEAGLVALCCPKSCMVKTIIIRGREETAQAIYERVEGIYGVNGDDDDADMKDISLEALEDALANWLVRYTAPIINTAGTVGELYFFGDGRDFPPGRKQRVTAQIAAYAASVIERVASLFALERVIWTDPLTGLVNRQCWLAKADEELARARRVHLPVSVVLIDLDGFKAINDYLGHAKGDEVLKRVGSAMRRRVRRYDVVARLGGDEFALLLPATPPSGAMVVAERMRNLIEEMDMSKILGCSVQLTASVGTATGPAAGETPDELLEAADRALREAKTSGKNRVVQDKGSQSVEEVAWSNVSLLFDTRLVRLFVNRICHEVNNPAQGILGLVELLLDDPDLELHMQAREDLKKIEELVLRLRDLTRKLANASHGELVKYAQEFAEMVRRMTPPEKAQVIDDVN